MRVEIRKRACCFIEICFLISAFATWFPGETAMGQQSTAVNTFIIEGNRKAVHYKDGRLVFYDGIDNNAKPIADVNCFEQRVISSKQGKYFATCSQFIGVTGPARIYNHKGEKIGEFNLERPWKVQAISDNGNLIALQWELEGESPFVSRLCDVKGNIVVDYNDINIATHINFAFNSTPVIWGKKGKPFISILDNKGQVITHHEFPNNDSWIDYVMLSENASILVLIEHIREKIFADRITTWNIKNNSLKTIIIPEDLWVMGQHRKISPSGAYVVLNLGAKAISLTDTKKGSEILHKTIDETLADGFKFEQILDTAVTDEGNFIVMVHSEGVVGYFVMNKTGKLIKSKVLDDFEHDGNIFRRFRIQELSKDKFVIVHKTNKIEIIDLK